MIDQNRGFVKISQYRSVQGRFPCMTAMFEISGS